MPSGKIHDFVAILSIIPAAIVGRWVLQFDGQEIITFIIAVIFSQVMFGPDLDAAKSCQYKRWGILKWVWLPYRKIFRHRSRFTHGIFLGPIFRCIYLFIACILIFYLLRHVCNILLGIDLIYSMPKLGNFLLNTVLLDFSNLLIPLIIGLFIGAAIHTFTDKIFSFVKNLI